MDKPLTQNFIDDLEAKKIKAHRADRESNTQKILDKLDELKPEAPEPIDLSETNQLLNKLIEESGTPWDIRLTLKLK